VAPPLSVFSSPPQPHRPLTQSQSDVLGAGAQLWQNIWQAATPWLQRDIDAELVMMVCEQTDERAMIREKMLGVGLDWRERTALRHLEKHITSNLSLLGFTPTDRARLGMASQPSDELQAFRDKVLAQRIPR